MTTWTRVADPEADAALLPAWLVARMTGRRGSFGLLVTSGDVVRVVTLTAAHLSSNGIILLDVLLDHAGVPDGVDTAWRSKHYLGAPVPGATRATVNLAHVVAAVEFVADSRAEQSHDAAEDAETAISTTVLELRQAAEDATERQS
jgi:hypothetical protein